MAQPLRALETPVEGQSLLLSTHMTAQLTTICNSNSRGYNALFWLRQVPDMHMLHIPVQEKHSHT